MGSSRYLRYWPRMVVAEDVLARHRPDGAEHLDLLVADEIGLEAGGRFHGRQREELQEVVLEHVAQHAHAVVIGAAMADGHLFGGGDLHVIDEIAVPHRLEDAVGEAEHQHILHGLLAQVVVDAIDLVFGEDLVDGGVQLPGRLQAGAEGLFDDDAAGAVVLDGQAGGAEMGDGRLVVLRRRGQVIDPRGVAAAFPLAQSPAQGGKVFPLGNVARHVIDRRRQRLPGRGVECFADIVGGRAAKILPPRVVAERGAGEADDPRAFGQPPLAEDFVQGGHQLAAGQVAGSAENNDGLGHGRSSPPQQRRGGTSFYRSAQKIQPARGLSRPLRRRCAGRPAATGRRGCRRPTGRAPLRRPGRSPGAG